ncbi:hypothetical protein ABDK00_001640 [Niabella insulamsoli]|uniref:hypothetical protein n=1 Tax=Niabella insulamsoli TaxID=3144874 RepID=UPI0031FC79D7
MSINNIEFAWEDITVTAMGRTFERILAIEYDKKRTKKQLYGRGSGVKGIQRQNVEPTGSLTLGQSEVEAMIRVAPQNDLTLLVMDIQSHYLNADSGAVVRDRIVGAEFVNLPKNFKQGDSDMEVKLDFLAIDILYQQ